MSIELQSRLVSDAWRILDRLGLVDTIFNHISIATPDSQGNLQLVMNPGTLLPNQLRPEHLCIVPLRDYSPSEATKLSVNPDGLHLHSQIHTERMRPGVVVHTHSLNCIAVGSSEQALLPLSQTAMEFVSDLEIIDYGGVFRSAKLTEEMKRIANQGGVALLRNHGALIVTDTIPDAVYLAYYLEEACRIQVCTLSQGVAIVLPDKSIIADACDALRQDRREAAERLFKALQRQFESQD
ncbi:MAG: class II aldolase/adducin family protein [Pyrinomonadaceae bacterium]